MFTKLKNVKLKKSEKRIIKIAVGVAVFVVLFNFVLYPLYTSYNSLQTEKAKLTKDIKEMQSRVKEAQKMLKEAAKLKKRYQDLSVKVIEAKNVELAQVFLEETITDYAKDRELTIQRIYKERAKDENGFKVVKARITVKGEYDNIIDFLHDIEQDPHYIYVESLVVRFYRGLEAVVSVKGIIRIKNDNKNDSKSGGEK